MISRASSMSSARTFMLVSSPNSVNPVSAAPRPTAKIARPPERRSNVTYSLATFQGRIRDSGDSIVPSCIVSVLTAAARRDTQASIPYTDSQTKKSPQPWAAVMAAKFTRVSRTGVRHDDATFHQRYFTLN